MRTAIISGTTGLIEVFSRRWSIDAAFYIAAGVGLASPFVHDYIYKTLPHEAAHYVFPIIAVILLSVCYWRMERGQFRRDRAALVSMVGATVLLNLGVLGSGWCYSHHICMGGHMEHPPYELWHYGLDVGWVLSLVSAAIWTRLFRAALCITFSVLAGFLISYRFLFGSFGGMYEGLPL